MKPRKRRACGTCDVKLPVNEVLNSSETSYAVRFWTFVRPALHEPGCLIAVPLELRSHSR